MKVHAHFQIIGDVHSRYQQYQDLLESCNYSLQVGDLGEDYSGLLADSRNHKAIAGNHENYGEPLPPHFLGDYGVFEIPGLAKNPDFNGQLFYVRGAASVQDMRVMGYNWYPEEELTHAQCLQAIEAYAQAKPDLVVTHDCPISVYKHLRLLFGRGIISKSRTSQMLQSMLEAHAPKLWVFGHHHQNRVVVEGATKFVCLGVLSALKFDRKLRIVEPHWAVV